MSSESSSLSTQRKPHLTIRPTSGWQAINFRELWQFRDLLMTLAMRDLKLRYRQTALGAIWIVLGPLMSAGIFSIIFGKIANLPSEGVPYFLYVYVGQLGWTAFNGALSRTQGSLVGNAHLISKIYFPRMVLPLSSVCSILIDFGVGLAVLIVLMLIHGVAPHAGLLLLPVWLFLLLIIGMGIGLIPASLTVIYRDAGNFVGPFTQALMYGSPVIYAVSVIPEKWRSLYYLNPLASLIQAFRWSLLGTSTPPWGYVAYSAVFAIAILLVGMFVFHRMERRFADAI